MKILAIDTSTSVMGVSLLDNDKVYAEIITNLKKNHSVRLMPTIDQIFSEVNWQPEEIDMVAVAKGPGSYTGVRIGVTTAKTFSWALGKPLVGVSTLETMAYENKFFSGVISPIIDARRGQVYTGLYRSTKGDWINVKIDQIVMMANWLEELKNIDTEDVLFVGDDTSIHANVIRKVLSNRGQIANPPSNISRPSIVGLLAKIKFENNQIESTFDFAPEYLQLAEAEVNWLNKQKQGQ